MEVRSNDTNMAGISLVIVTYPTNGTAYLTSGGISYTPNSGYVGNDQLTYKGCYNGVCSNVATVSISVVNQAPTTQNDSFSVHSSMNYLFPFVNGTGGDSDPDNDPLNMNSLQIITQPLHGTIEGITDGVVYRQNLGYTGTDSLQYRICDSLGACSTGTVTINVLNQAPIANTDIEVVRGYAAINFLTNDSDPDGDTISYAQILTQPTKGGVQFYGNWASYNSYGQKGYDSFSYRIVDHLGKWSAPATVHIYMVGNGKGENLGSCVCPEIPTIGNPVNMANGNMWISHNDYSTKAAAGGEPSIIINRFYNAQMNVEGLFGHNWTSKYDARLKIIDNLLAEAVMDDGRSVFFRRITVSDPFELATLEKAITLHETSTGVYTLTYRNKRQDVFDSTGKLTSTKQPGGLQTNLTYDSNGKLTSIVDAFGNTVTLTTNSNKMITKLEDSLGVISEYAYNSDKTLNTVTYPDGSLYRFSYHSNGNKILYLVQDASNNVLEAHGYGNDGYISSEYVASHQEKYALYYNDGYIRAIDLLNRVTVFYSTKIAGRDVVNKVINNSSPSAANGVGPGSSVTEKTYDSNLNVTKIKDGLNRETTFTYDFNGNKLTETNTIGTNTFTYNALNQVLTHVDKDGKIWTNSFDSNGNLLTASNPLGNTSAFTYNSYGQLLTATDPLGKQTSITYNTTGLPVTVTDANNKVTSYAYDLRGRVVSVTNAKNEVVQIEYDLNNRIKKVINPDLTFKLYAYDINGRNTGITDELAHTTTFAYDEAYRLTSTTNANNQTSSYGYDVMSNLTSVTDALNKVRNFEYDAFNRVNKVIYPAESANATRLFETSIYDLAGNLISSTDTANRTTIYSYDAANRPIKSTDPNAKETALEFNARGLRTKVIDALNQQYLFAYDDAGRMVSETRDGKTKFFAYDAAGNLTGRTDFKNVSTSYVYDALNRLTSVVYPTTSQNVTLTYDDLSRPLTATNQNGTVSMNYNNRGWMNSTTDPNSQTVGYSYDASGNRTGVNLNSVPYQTNTFDNLDRLTQITTVSDSTNIGFSYDNANKLIAKTLPNGITTDYSYDGVSRIKRIKDSTTGGTLYDRQLTYNTASQISQIAEPSLTRNFSYDSLNRLTGVTNGSLTPIESYSFDDVGNRSSSHLSPSYGYTGVNKLTSSTGNTYAYDDNGNMTGKTDSTGTTNYTWDYENRLVKVTKPDTSYVAYKYDAFGRRIERIPSTGILTKFTYDGQDVILDTNSDNTTVKYINGQGIDNKLRQTSSAGAEYFLTDHLGSTNALADSTGSVTSSATYDSFGNQNGTLGTRYGYTGREYDSFSELNYHRARYYSPSLGRFVSQDPIGLNGGINLFGYSNNDSINYKDPTGNIPVFAVTGLIGAGVGAVIGGGITASQGGSLEEIIKDAGVGAVAGGVSGLTLGLGSTAAVTAYIGSGYAATVATGVIGGGAGDYLGQQLAVHLGRQECVDYNRVAKMSVVGGLLGAAGKFTIHPTPTSGNVKIVNYNPLGTKGDLNSGRWVMVGENSYRNYVMSGQFIEYGIRGLLPSARHQFAKTGKIDVLQLTSPSRVKGLLGQRIIK